jgi:serine protease Do
LEYEGELTYIKEVDNMNPFRKLFKTQIGWALLGGAAVGVAGTIAFLHSHSPAVADLLSPPVLAQNELDTLAALDSASTKLVEQIMPTVVSIEAGRGQGSGVVYRADGYIMTNAHVVGRADTVNVIFSDGTELKGKVIRDDSEVLSDLAVVKVEKTGLKAARFADSGNVRLGQLAIAVGAPFGYEQSVSFGHVSGLGRRNAVPDASTPAQARFYFNMVQTDAAMNPGNSGGPLMNYRGEVIGINSAISSMTGANSGVGFAIPSNTAVILADQLIEHGKIRRGYLGLTPEDLKGAEIKKLNISRGAIVRDVQSGTPADVAGIKPGDVIVEISGKDIRGEQDVRDSMLLHPPGKSVVIKLVRNGTPKTVSVKLGDRPDLLASSSPGAGRQPTEPSLPFGPFSGPLPEEGNEDQPPATTSPVRLGVVVRSMTPEELANLPAPKKGVYVEQVEPNSVAARAGLEPGMVILRVGNKEIASAEQLREAVSQYKRGQTTLLTFGKFTPEVKMTQSVTVRF